MKKVIGIDLGGTSIIGGILNEKGQILKRKKVDSAAYMGRDVVIKNIVDLISSLLDGEVEAIGIGTPGFVDSKLGKILSISTNIKDWPYTNLKKEIEDIFRLPVFVENDGNVATICEAWVGSGKDMDSFVMLTLGTGVGGGIYSKKGGLVYGNQYEGGEIGHSILYPKGEKCVCGQCGCVEKYVSGRAIEDNYFKSTGIHLSAENIFRVMDVDPMARKTVDKFVEDLAIVLVTIKNIFDPGGIIIGGGVIYSKDYWWPSLIESYRKNVNSNLDLHIRASKYLNDSGIVGAGKIALLNTEQGDLYE